MNIIYFLAPLALLLGFGFAAGFIYAALRGQFDDVETPAHKILFGDGEEHSHEMRSRDSERSHSSQSETSPTLAKGRVP